MIVICFSKRCFSSLPHRRTTNHIDDTRTASADFKTLVEVQVWIAVLEIDILHRTPARVNQVARLVHLGHDD
jgi:hypothetical protein